jgi:hypothetical protein
VAHSAVKDLQKENQRERLESLCLLHLTYKKEALLPHPHPMRRSMRNSKLNRELEVGSSWAWWTERGHRAWLLVHPLAQGVLGSLTGVAMFLKRCDPSELCFASNSFRAGGLDDGRYGSEELGPLQSPPVGAAEEREQ